MKYVTHPNTPRTYNNRSCRGRYEHRSQIAHRPSIITNAGSNGRGFCRSGALFHGVVKVGARRLQGTAQKGFRLQAHSSMTHGRRGVCCDTFYQGATCATINPSTYQLNLRVANRISTSIKEREAKSPQPHPNTSRSSNTTCPPLARGRARHCQGRSPLQQRHTRAWALYAVLRSHILPGVLRAQVPLFAATIKQQTRTTTAAAQKQHIASSSIMYVTYFHRALPHYNKLVYMYSYSLVCWRLELIVATHLNPPRDIPRIIQQLPVKESVRASFAKLCTDHPPEKMWVLTLEASVARRHCFTASLRSVPAACKGPCKLASGCKHMHAPMRVPAYYMACFTMVLIALRLTQQYSYVAFALCEKIKK